MSKRRIFNLPNASILMLAAAMAMSGNARAQVTIGADLAPQPFSVLELISNGNSGLRLPQMTTDQRNALNLNSLQGEAAQKARGLQIFNISTYCVETWNGTKWIEACMDCSDVAAPVISSSSPFPACSVGGSVTFTASPAGDYKWQISSDNGTTWTDASGTGSSNSIPFASAGNYLIRASAYGCNEKISNVLSVQALTSIVNLGNLHIMTLNNVLYSYQYAKLATSHTGTALGYQWYMKFAGYNVQGGNIPSTLPAVDETNDIIVGANQSSYTFDPYSDSKYQGAGSYYFYCKAFGKNGATDVVSSDVILVRVDDLYDASRSNLLITKEQWKEDSTTNEVPGGQMYFIPVLYGSSNASLKIAHANLGSAKTRDAGELGSLYQWARNEDGHEYRQYNGKYDNWNNLNNKTNKAGTETFVSSTSSTKVSSGQAASGSAAYGKFITVSASPHNWTGTDYTDGWGKASNGSTDPCYSRNNAWRIPSGGNISSSDFAKLTAGSASSFSWSNNTVSNQTNQNTVLYRYPWGSRYSTSVNGGSITIASKNSFDGDKKYVAILPASGYRYDSSGALFFAGEGGYYSSSTFLTDYAHSMYFGSSHVYAGSSTNDKSLGNSVRCVCEAE
ncbi:MAG: hypothetical protein LBB53_04610 [Prevotellaceae bacterium]|jgi:hypothetical protein|nr:hypothetical protein [Prevotellaceae bacterium]